VGIFVWSGKDRVGADAFVRRASEASVPELSSAAGNKESVPSPGFQRDVFLQEHNVMTEPGIR